MEPFQMSTIGATSANNRIRFFAQVIDGPRLKNEIVMVHA